MSETKNINATLLDKTVIEINQSTINKYKTGSDSDKLFISEKIIYGLKNTISVQEIMKLVGYHEQKIAVFSGVYESALALYINHQKRQSDKLISHDNFIKLYDAVKNDFRFMLKVAKLALKNQPHKADKLQLSAKYGKSIADVFTSMEVFYTKTLEDSEIIDAFSAFGYHAERINGLYKNFKLCFENYKKYGTDHAEAVESTRVKNLKIKELDGWVLEYFTLVKVAKNGL